MLSIVVGSLLVLSLVLLGYVFYSSEKSKVSNTREQYAIKCLTAIVALVTLCLTSISSKQSIPDQIVGLISRILGAPVPDTPPAPLSEQVLMVIVVGFAITLIFKSHRSWQGAISADEENKRRMKQSTGLISQALDEVVRVVKVQPRRKLYEKERRVDPVVIPEEPNLVWHDHARELFELWAPSVSFGAAGLGGWHQREKVWSGRDKVLKKDIFVLCLIDFPSDGQIDIFKTFAANCSATAELYLIVQSVPSDFLLIDGRERYNGLVVLSEKFLYEHIVDFSDYFNDVVRRVEKDCFAESDLTIRDIYTPSSLSSDSVGKDVIADDFGGYLADWARRPPGKQVAIMGEYGQGKSTGALMYVYQSYKSQLQSSAGRVPILLELRGKSPANLAPPELLAAWAQQYQLQAAALMKLLIAGRLILIFEGFDEMANIASVEARVAHFRSLWQFAFQKSKIVFTGRRNLFFEDRELNVVFKGSQESVSGPLCDVLHLCAFDESKIKGSLRWVDEVTANEILSAARSSKQILDIVARPSLLYIVAKLWGEIRPLLLQGNISSAQVIDKFVMHSYSRQQMKESRLGFMVLTTTERRYFHEGLAAYMASRGRTNQVAPLDLQAAIQRLYKAYPHDCHISDNVVLETDRPPLKERFLRDEDAIEAILTDVRTHGILVNDLSQRGAFRFAHKSFYEMLAAKVQAYSTLDIEKMFYRSIKEAMDGEIELVRSSSPEIFGFFSELFIFHLRQRYSHREIIFSAFDLLVGANKPIAFSRWFRLILISAMHNRLVRRCVLVGTILGMLFLIFSSSDFGRSILGLSQSKAEWKASSSGFFIFSSLVSGLIFGFFSTSVSTKLASKSRLWVAVLLASDTSSGSEDSFDALHRIFGRRTAVDIILKTLEEYPLSLAYMTKATER
ncbi:NACHT domain-containing NTPase [Pseudomonas sp. Irchel s3h9]|uniref:NACHT domain-containing protein n=1 Tax=Pseudomonas sp. Irchel s3h9 TaxID=2009192 RepID=UPI00114044A0|nr:hypothetical protein [Pseudomonas sp. Irchel s3h9]